MGLQQIGAIQIPIYPTTSIEHYKHIFTEAEVKVVILSEKAVYDKIKPALDDTVQHLYTFEKTEGLEHWEDFLAKGQNSREEEITAIKNKVKPDDTATIIYTSGTTGPPKGVMLTHRNFISTILGVIEIIDQNPVKTAISFLPLCHVYERMLSYFYQYKNITVYYAESIEALGDNLREVQPEMFCAVPRVLEKTYDKIINKGRNLPLLPKIIFYWALRLGEQYDHHEQKGWWYHFQLKIANILVFKKWRKGLGGNLKLIVSGGATLQSKLARTFWAAGIDVMEGYGLTETSPVIAVSSYIDNGIKIGTVGPVLKGVQVKFADDGEILCKGPNVMKGYYRQPEKTKEVLGDDGWFKTGDIGHLEDGRFLKITDRKKEMFKTSGGKYIAPQVIENMMKGSPFIENVLVVGDNKKFPAALVVPNFYHLRSWCNVKGITYTNDKEMIENQRIIDRYEREVAEMNQHFGKVEQIKKIALLSEPWSIETGELSPTLKLKRRVLYQKYEETIEALYEEA
ncbi:MAG: long-chain fatty acid--CoA ligase [Bacteroidales bacterium]|nr:long-chain fatty acid--CoA ligase [Bacteroidales bacterium]